MDTLVSKKHFGVGILFLYGHIWINTIKTFHWKFNIIL